MAFSKGFSGNPAGRPSGVKSSKMTRVSKKDAAAALMFLSQTMNDETQSIDVRTIAAAAIFSAAIQGKAVNHE